MKKLPTLVTLSVALAALTFAVIAPQSVEGNNDKLQKAQTLTATINIQPLGGAATDFNVLLSKPNLAKIESSANLKSTDGKIVVELDKSKNMYSQSPFTPEALLNWVIQPELFGWSAFYSAEVSKTYTVARTGKIRKIRNTEVTSYPVTFNNSKDSADLYVENATGLVRGYSITRSEKQFIVWATKLEISNEPTSSEKFAFQPPAGAKEASVATAESAKWETVAKILNDNCLPCHGEAAIDGLDIRTYQTLMASGKIKAGNAAESGVIRSLKSTRRPMPPRPKSPLPADQIATIEAWINAGAKE